MAHAGDNAVYMSVSDPSCFTISRLIRALRKCRYLIPSAWHIMSFLGRVTLRPVHACTSHHTACTFSELRSPADNNA